MESIPETGAKGNERTRAGSNRFDGNSPTAEVPQLCLHALPSFSGCGSRRVSELVVGINLSSMVLERPWRSQLLNEVPASTEGKLHAGVV